MKQLFLLLFIFFSVNNYIFGQSCSCESYTILDGLAQNQVTSLCQTDDGYIWVGTKAGLSRFDGINFKNYTTIDGENIGNVKHLFKTSSNQLFIITNNSVYSFNNEMFTQIFKMKKNSYISRPSIPLAQQNKDDFCFSYKTLKEKSSNQYDYFIVFYKNGIFYKEKTLIRNLLFSSPILPSERDKNRNPIFKKVDIDTIYNVRADEINLEINYFEQKRENFKDYYSFKNFIILKDFKNSTIKYFTKGDKTAKLLFSNIMQNKCAIRSSDKNLWVQNDNKIYEYDSTLQLKHIYKNELFSQTTSSIIKDNRGGLWVGTEGGLVRVVSIAFENFTEEDGINDYIWSIVENDNNEILFASYYGDITLYDGEKIEPYKIEFDNLDMDNYYKNNRLYFYMGGTKLNNGYIVIPSTIFKYGPFKIKNNKFSPLFPASETAYFTGMSAYNDEIKEHLIYGTAKNTIYDYNYKTDSLKAIQTSSKNTLCIERKDDSTFYIAGNDNLQIYDGEKLSIMDVGREKGFFSIKKDNRDNLWLGDIGGLHFWNGDSLRQITENYPKQLTTFISLFLDRYIIAGTITGFGMIDLEKFYAGEEKFLKFFNKDNGFIGIECGQNGTCVASDSTVWIPTSNSVVRFNPLLASDDTIAPQTHITSFYVSDESLVWRKIANEYSPKDSIYRFDYHNSNVRINYHGIFLKNPQSVKYKITLKSDNDVWEEDSEEKSITYTNLKSGEYTFSVISCNEDGYWNTQPTEIHFQIIPAIWQQLWFQIISLLLLLFLVFLSTSYYFSNKRKKQLQQQEIDKKLVSLQLKSIESQIDPHFVFNAITAIGVDVQENALDNAYNNFAKMAKLLRSSLTKTNSLTRTISEEIDFTKNYLDLQKLRFEDRINYEINIEDEIDPKFEIPRMSLQTLVENAVKHGIEHKLDKTGFLKIHVFSKNDYFIAEIEDNGVGRTASAKHSTRSTGVGLSVLNQFFDIYNKKNAENARIEIIDLFDDHKKARGTKAILAIPINYKFVI